MDGKSFTLILVGTILFFLLCTYICETEYRKSMQRINICAESGGVVVQNMCYPAVRSPDPDCCCPEVD